jgi:hypothetical protein
VARRLFPNADAQSVEVLIGSTTTRREEIAPR